MVEVKKRIEWIDALRGFTMVLVVFSHVELHMLEMPVTKLNDFFILFRMPLFFFVSGFISFKQNEFWNMSYFLTNVLKKIRVQLIPTLFFGLLFCLIVFSRTSQISYSESVSRFVNSSGKLGYWFTIALLSMFIIYYLISFIFGRFNIKIKQIVLISAALLMAQISLKSHPFYEGNPYFDLFCLDKVFMYFQFFIFGNMFSCYKELCFRILNNCWVKSVLVLCFFGLPLLYSSVMDSSENIFVRKLFYRMINPSISFCGILTVVTVFKQYSAFFSSTTRVGRCLQYIGKRTLDIYMIHYFLLSPVPLLGAYVIGLNNSVLESIVCFSIAFAVILFSLLISYILRVSPLLSHFLFGTKFKKEETC